jgi:hypothetical protein
MASSSLASRHKGGGDVDVGGGHGTDLKDERTRVGGQPHRRRPRSRAGSHGWVTSLMEGAASATDLGDGQAHVGGRPRRTGGGGSERTLETSELALVGDLVDGGRRFGAGLGGGLAHTGGRAHLAKGAAALATDLCRRRRLNADLGEGRSLVGGRSHLRGRRARTGG